MRYPTLAAKTKTRRGWGTRAGNERRGCEFPGPKIGTGGTYILIFGARVDNLNTIEGPDQSSATT